jgi:8-amino-7-oxononanoate synthase
VDFSSNSYLSFANNPELRKRYISLLSDDTNFSLGSGGSRLLDGNNASVEDLESTIAAFHRAPSGLLFNSGLDANTGLFGCVSQPGDMVIYDELIHASVHDGMKLGRAKRIAFAHNAVATGGDGSIKCLDVVLQELCSGTRGDDFFRGKKNVFIAVEGVYSMDGDTTPLQEIVACVQQRLPEGNGYIIVDEAHSTGVIGDRGRGLVCHLGLEDQIWARVHTFGKAMGCSGGTSTPLVSLTAHTN